MNFSRTETPLSKEQAFALVDAVMEHEALALTASAHEEADGGWVFEATCTKEPDLNQFAEIAREILGGDVGFASEPIDPKEDWVAKSLEGLQPVRSGGFYIHGSHDEVKLPAGITAIEIDAAQAFGTGHHETTTGCLEAIEQVLKRRSPRYPLDLGTGTGVLAIAMAKRLRLPVIATDIDPIAVRTTLDNARRNQVSGDVIAVRAAGTDHQTIKQNAPYDLIVANILAGPLAGLAPDISDIAQSGASIILSGILAGQAARVASAYRQQGMVLRSRIVKGSWVTLTLDKH